MLKYLTAALIALSLSISLAFAGVGIRASNFDWDDNIMRMPVKNYLYHRVTGEERGVSTEEYAAIKDKIGKEGEWKDFIIHPDDHPRATFREVLDVPGENNFLDQLVHALKEPSRRGPSFDAFIKSLSSPARARHASIITARGQSRERLYEGLVYLKKYYAEHFGMTLYLPPIENIYCVSHETYKMLHGNNISKNKLVAMRELLDRLDREPLLTPGTKHLWGFSDDDYTNFKRALDALSDDVKQGRWPNVEVSLFYTGPKRADQELRSLYLAEGGIPKAQVRDLTGVTYKCSSDFRKFPNPGEQGFAL